MSAARTRLLLAALLAGCATAPAVVADNPRLAALYAADQQDRRATPDSAWSTVERNDAERRRELRAMLERGEVRTGADHYHAAMIFQHGSDSTAFRQAMELAREAERRGHAPARWLAAASLDRYLLSTGRPQHYGTQFMEGRGALYLLSIDTLAVTDAERRRAGARTLDEIRAYLAEKNGTASATLAPPPAEAAEPQHERTVELVGGLDALARQVRYPDAARAARVAGTVRVQLTVKPDGTVGEAFVVDGLGHGIDEEVLRVVRAARFVNYLGEPWEIRLAVPVAP